MLMSPKKGDQIMAIRVVEATHRPSFTMNCTVTVSGTDPKTEWMRFSKSTIILPTEVHIEYRYRDGEWAVAYAYVSGPRLLSSGLLGKTTHRIDYWGSKVDGMPEWVRDIVHANKPTLRIMPGS